MPSYCATLTQRINERCVCVQVAAATLSGLCSGRQQRNSRHEEPQTHTPNKLRAPPSPAVAELPALQRDEDEQSHLIQKRLERMPAALERLAKRMRDESEGSKLAKQFFSMMRFASKAALVRNGFAELRRSPQGSETFIPLDDEFRDPDGQRAYMSGKTVVYGPDEVLPRRKLFVSDLMAEMPPQWVEEFQKRVRVHAFRLHVCSKNKNDHPGGMTEHVMVRTVMKFDILKDGKPEGGCYYKTDNQGQLFVMDGVFQAQPPPSGSMRCDIVKWFIDTVNFPNVCLNALALPLSQCDRQGRFCGSATLLGGHQGKAAQHAHHLRRRVLPRHDAGVPDDDGGSERIRHQLVLDHSPLRHTVDRLDALRCRDVVEYSIGEGKPFPDPSQERFVPMRFISARSALGRGLGRACPPPHCSASAKCKT